MGISKRLQLEERAVMLRARRMTFFDIAEELGITVAAAKAAVNRGAAKRAIDKEQERRLEAAALEDLVGDLTNRLRDEDLSVHDRVKITAEIRALRESYRRLMNLDEKDDTGDRGIVFNINTSLPAVEIVEGESEEIREIGSGGDG